MAVRPHHCEHWEHWRAGLPGAVRAPMSSAGLPGAVRARHSRTNVAASAAGHFPLAPPLDRRADAHRLAIFGDGAAGDIEALDLEQVDQLVVAEDFGFGGDQLADRRLDGFGRRPFTLAAAAADPGTEEIYELEHPSVAKQ